MRALVDGDVIAHAVGSMCEKLYFMVDGVGYDTKGKAKKAAGGDESRIEIFVEPETIENCLHSVKLMLEDIVTEAQADEYTVYLSGPSEDNFRKKLFPEYKAHRDPRKPHHHENIRNYLIEHHGAIVSEGMEADDYMGIEQCGEGVWDKTIICSIDKDLDTIPGWHYRWAIKRKGEVVTPSRRYYIEPEEAEYIFWEQVIVGDTSDGIPGLYKTTGKRATKKIKEGLRESDNPEQYVRELYEGHDLELDLIIDLIRILQEKPCGKKE